MRYIIAMVCGSIAAALAATLLSGPAARWVSQSFTYTSPDGQNDVEQMVFLGIMITAMAVGWAIGWAAGASFAKRERLD